MNVYLYSYLIWKQEKADHILDPLNEKKFCVGAFFETSSFIPNDRTGCFVLVKWMLRMPQRNWVSATNSDFLIPISLQLDGVDLWYFKL